MKLIPTKITGCFLITLEKHVDERGFLARCYDKQVFLKNDIKFNPVEGYTCFTGKIGTLRGFHYLAAPHRETKLTRVIRGSLFEVVIDLRRNSKTYKQWFGVTMKASDGKMLLIPPGCAHAILTLEDDTEYLSLYSPPYEPSVERGLRYNDPLFKITWPIKISHVSEKDLKWPNFKG